MIALIIDRLRARLSGNAPTAVSTLDPRSFLRLASVAVVAAGAIFAGSFIHSEPAGKAGAISVTHPWARGGARAGQQLPVHATFENAGSSGDRLISAASPMAERTIIKELDRRGGLISPRELDGWSLPPLSRQTLRPGEAQITLDRVKMGIAPGDRVPITLQFERAGIVTVMVMVENVGQPDHTEHFPAADRFDERRGLRR